MLSFSASELMVALAVLMAADVASTRAFLARGGHEANPIVRAVIDRAGVRAFAALKLAVFLAVLALVVLTPVPEWVLWVLIAMHAGLVINNMLYVRRLP